MDVLSGLARVLHPIPAMDLVVAALALVVVGALSSAGFVVLRERRALRRFVTYVGELESALAVADAERVRFRRMAVDVGVRLGRRIGDEDAVVELLCDSSECEVSEVLSRVSDGAFGDPYLSLVNLSATVTENS